MNYKTVVSQFIPIIVAFLFIFYTDWLVIFSNSILGKVIALGIVVFYTILDKYVGMFVCALVLFFYQLGGVENMLNKTEGFVEYHENHDADDTPQPNIAQTEFREENCKNNLLKYKNMTVKPDMAEHVFPELKFKNGTCNPCESSCKFSIIESKLKAQSELTPIHSKAAN